NGKLEGEIVYLQGSTASDTAQTGKGTMFMIEHTQDGILGGFNKLAFVYGEKLGGVPWAPTYASGDKGSETAGNADGSSAKQWRVVEQLYIAPANTNWSGMATLAYANMKCCGWLGAEGDKKWLSVGARPQYAFSDNFSVAVEAGYDQTKVGTVTAKLAKLTVAPQLSLSKGFWARPVFRGFVTYAKWNSAAGTQAGGVFGTKTNGLTYGAQVEAWW
ncbi:MAG TPA: carbohydrate porin, partial [Albitalea sp.]|nr:carbohydrate porin [Albitalea sp.]